MMNWPLPERLLGMENAMAYAFTQFLPVGHSEEENFCEKSKPLVN